jgi:hypothetical protein
MRRLRIFPILVILLLACNIVSPAGSADTSSVPPETPEDATSEKPTPPLDNPEPDQLESPEGGSVPSDTDAAPPGNTVKLIFIHHSSGENWLADWSGGLGKALMENNYFVSDTNYGWGPEDSSIGGAIGDYTDIGHWWNWFGGPSSETIMHSVYSESEQHSDYARRTDDPGG